MVKVSVWYSLITRHQIFTFIGFFGRPLCHISSSREKGFRSRFWVPKSQFLWPMHSIQFKKLWQFFTVLNWFLLNNSVIILEVFHVHLSQVLGHTFLASVLWKHAKSLDITSQSAIKSFYMFIWKVETTTCYSLHTIIWIIS